MLPLSPVQLPALSHSSSRTRRLGLLAALSLALTAGAPAAEVGVGVNLDVHASVKLPAPVVHVPVPVIPVPVPVVPVPVPVAPPPPVVVHTVHYRSELSCGGEFYYQAHSSDWVTHARGSLSLELPARIRTGDYPCRIAIAGLGEFNAAPDSEFLVTPNADSLYDLRIFRGGVRYAVSSRATLRVSSAFGLGASVSGVRATVAHPCRGRAVIYGEDSLQLENLDGDLAFERDGRSLREVAAGHGLRISLAAARERSAERELIYRDVNAYDDGYDYDSKVAASHGKSIRKTRVTYAEETEVREDTHSHQRGKGHYEHGNGKGLGHYKERAREEETVSVQSYARGDYEKGHGKALGHGKERREEAVRVQAYARNDNKEHGKASGRDKEHGNDHDRGNDHGNGKGKGKGHGK